MTISRLLRTAIVVGIAAAALIVPQLALADPPIHQTVPLSVTLSDVGFCSFPVAETLTGQVDQTISSDGSQIWHIHRLATWSANGKSVISNADFTRFLDPSQPNLIDDSGAILNVQVPGYGDIYMQTGKLLFNQQTGQVDFDAGNDDLFAPDGVAALCSYLGS